MVNISADRPTSIRREPYWALQYFALYLISLFSTLESEFLHWFTLVIIPILALMAVRKQKRRTNRLRSVLASAGLNARNLKRGLVPAAIVGAVFCGLQLFLSRDGKAIMSLLQSGKALYLFPISLLLMAVTAGFTEEFFFRGIVQTRMEQLFRSRVLAVGVTSLLFGLYHLPYAYLNPRWPSHDNWPGAIASAFGQGVPLGIVFGILYIRSKHNLLSSVLAHSLVNAFPAMLVIQRLLA